MSPRVPAVPFRPVVCYDNEDVHSQLLARFPKVQVSTLQSDEQTCPICLEVYESNRILVYPDTDDPDADINTEVAKDTQAFDRPDQDSDNDTEVDEGAQALGRLNQEYVAEQIRLGNRVWDDAQDLYEDAPSQLTNSQQTTDGPEMPYFEINDGTEMVDPPVRLPCSHVFGRACVLEWFVPLNTGVVHSDKCPTCRAKVFEIQTLDELSDASSVSQVLPHELFHDPSTQAATRIDPTTQSRDSTPEELNQESTTAEPVTQELEADNTETPSSLSSEVPQTETDSSNASGDPQLRFIWRNVMRELEFKKVAQDAGLLPGLRKRARSESPVDQAEGSQRVRRSPEE